MDEKKLIKLDSLVILILIKKKSSYSSKNKISEINLDYNSKCFMQANYSINPSKKV